MGRVRMAVVGVGHLGKEHARILASLPDVDLVGVADVNLEQAQTVARRHNTQAFAEYWPLLTLVDAACIVVPSTHHYAVAGEFLKRGLPVLVEKPLALDERQAAALVELAERRGALLQVGHIERFNPAFEDLLNRPLQPRLIRSERHSGFTGRSTDIGVVLDLMIHDLDLVLALVRSPVVDVQAVAVSVFGRHEDVCQAWLRFANGCVATLSANRASSTPARSMQVWGAEGFIRVDFSKRQLTLTQPSEEVRRHGLDPRRLDATALARLKDEVFGRHLHVLEVDRNQGEGTGDQLTRELQHFVHCVQTGATPRVSGTDGRDAVALAQRIMDYARRHRWEEQAPAAMLFAPNEGKIAA